MTIQVLPNRPGAIRKHFAHGDSGVLDVKLKRLLKKDISVVAIGKQHMTPNNASTQSKSSKNASTKKREIVRRGSFRNERREIMDSIEMPIHTRKIVDKVVNMKKKDDIEAKMRLPPVVGAFKKRPVPQSNFPTAYRRGELPVMIEHKTGGNSLKWTVNISDLDMSFYLPLFFEGIREKKDPYNFLARMGVQHLLEHGKQYPAKIHACLHNVVLPIRTALNTRDPMLVCDTLKYLRKMLAVEGIGVALLPYYRQILPVLNIFKHKRRNFGDKIDYAQRNDRDLGQLIQETLEMMERTGGPDAYVNLKYMVPTYEGITIH